MKILGISTALKYTGAALVDGQKVVSELTCQDTKSEDLMVLVKRIMEESGVEIGDTGAVAVCQGPGSYSGLRGGLAAAKGLAQALGIPVAGVSTLETVAMNLGCADGTIAVAVDAVRGEHNFALFSSSGGVLRRVTDDLVLDEKRLGAFLSGINGEGLRVVTNLPALKAAYPHLCFAGDESSIPYARNAAFLGRKKLMSGSAEDVLAFAPKYSHMPKIREYTK